ncbi:Equilibrative nucleotide transporter 2 [Morella rubra]|uniref:Equilibrative nucleotide transporter 2 n=1 Tax=Morella rubra TaxID=262757 RepID=A0A6A1WF68_9ROSI|nr:Equilibrative nucleotide transporter 2 [Morella rubra]
MAAELIWIHPFLCKYFVAPSSTSGKGGVGPFIGLCVLSACFGVADAHVQGGMLGDLSFMCPEFIQLMLVYKRTLRKEIFKLNHRRGSPRPSARPSGFNIEVLLGRRHEDPWPKIMISSVTFPSVLLSMAREEGIH